GVSIGTAQTNEFGRAVIDYPVNVAPGSHTITASYAGDSPYQPSSGTGTLSVDRRPLTVTANDVVMQYGSQIPTMTASFSGLASWDTATSVGVPSFSINATSGSNVGQYTITPSGVTSGKYTVTYFPGVLTIEKALLNVAPDSFTRWENYDNPVLTGSLTGVISTDDITISYETDAVRNSPVGTYAIDTEIIDPENRLGNYEVTVTPAELIVYAAPLPNLSHGDTKKSVTGNIGLPAEDGGARPIVWASSDEDVLESATGRVLRPSYLEGDAEITLQARVMANGEVYEALYDLTILAEDMTDEEAVDIDLQNLEIAYSTGDDATQVRGTLTLPTSGANGTSIAWTSSMPMVID
ncbi:immunoglobulin-like domain-containing protein, partial [Peribacillus sp. NPDC056705]|uniref:immunoglobulin-like domain-containing protein n=1 Tax=Peribacillus sp. NPDC056705 TaxID=3345918 RepID=UPI00374A56C6